MKSRLLGDVGLFARAVRGFPSVARALNYSRRYADTARKAEEKAGGSVPLPTNPLREYFEDHMEGRGIWKWEHYLDIYHRHLAKFRGQRVDVLEIGVYSGGSLEMWRSYFGERSHIYGVDIKQACKRYENDRVSVFIGDQADRAFWSSFRRSVDGIDVVIDDGGHRPKQQRVTLEEMLPYLRPGGVYLCEDVHPGFNRYAVFATALVHGLNAIDVIPGSAVLGSRLSRFQSSVHSMHFYPYVVVIEKHSVPPTALWAPKHGTEWLPFP